MATQRYSLAFIITQLLGAERVEVRWVEERQIVMNSKEENGPLGSNVYCSLTFLILWLIRGEHCKVVDE